jgi:hypothetical protein
VTGQVALYPHVPAEPELADDVLAGQD